MAAVLTPSPCPNENAIIALVQGRASVEDRRAIEAHLDACMGCHLLIAEVARASRSAVPPRHATEAAPGFAPTTTSALPVRGTHAGRYRLEEIIGAGAMGVVYAAYDDELARRVAVKVVRPEWSGSEQHRTRLLREACALARVGHPNVVTVYDVGTMFGNVFIAMEHVDGGSLQHWLRGRPRGWRETLAVVLGAARGLAAAHEAGVVHRDFKPQNVLISAHGRAVVADFGLACSVGVSPYEPGANRHASSPVPALAAITATGAVLGTPAYMAPEQRDGAPTDARSDQYSFCVVLHEALHGERPSAVPTSRKRVPVWLDRALARGLASDPNRRYPSMNALIAALVPRSRTWPWLLPLLTIVPVVAAGLIPWRRHVQREQRERDTCSVAARSAGDIWRSAGPRVKETFLATGLPYAATTWRGVDHHLANYVGSWSTMQLQVCTDALRTGKTELTERQEACLADRVDELSASIALLSSADPGIVEGAPSLVSALVPPTQCGNVSALSPLLTDPSKATKIREFNSDYNRVHTLIMLGRYAEAREPAEANARAAEQLHYGPAQAKAQLNLGVLRRLDGDREAADAAFLRALALADAAGNDRLKVGAWLDLLANVASHPEAGFDRVPLYEVEAKAALQRLGGDEALEAALRLQLALVLMVEGNLTLARSEGEWALAAAKRRLPTEDIQLVRMLSVVGNIAIREGRDEDALLYFREALDRVTQSFGPDAPAAAESLSNIGTTLGGLDRAEEGLGYANRSVALAERDLPADHPMLAQDLDLRASLYEALGRHEDARRDAQRSMAIVEKRFGRESPFLVGMLTTLGSASLGRGDVEPAVASLERAVALCGPACAQITRANAMFALAKALRQAGRQPKRVLTLADESARIYTTANDPTAATVAAWRRAK